MEQESKDEVMEYFNALYQVAKMVNRSLETSSVLGEIVRRVTESMNARASILRLLESKGQKLALGASFGLSEGYLRKGPIELSESRLDRRVMEGETVWIKDTQNDPAFQYGEEARAEGIKSVLAAPLFIEDKVIGVLRVYAGDVRQFDHHDVQFLEAVANLSAIALDNARHHERLKIKCDLMAEHKYRLDDH
ncbi:MAG: GAF domain-containing protein [Syntrophales bacterium]|jgi:signal transduction protein with GAF and PtsI domain|nr:GAF domain-containing protein [Syntrophales bacterium]MDY0043307.1 GAF domain-containing protein [Syntrophales bacterium]